MKDTGTHDRGRPGIATGCIELASSLDGAMNRGDWEKVREVDHKRTDQYGASRVVKHTQFVRTGVYILFLFEAEFHPAQILVMVHKNAQQTRTVRSLMSVDFPAPLGPIIPTRLPCFVSKSA